MKPTQLFTALAASLVLAGAANAALITSVSGANTVADYSTASLAAFDLDLQNFSGSQINFVLEDGDLLGPLSLNALVRNLSGHGLQHFTMSLQGISLLATGSVTPAFGTVGQISHNGSAAAIRFGAPEFAEFQFGNPFAIGGKRDWLLDTSGLRAGDAFSVTATVAEPASLTLFLSALALFGVAAVRRRQIGKD